MLLLDTDVLSALRRRDRNPNVVNWVEAQPTSDMYLGHSGPDLFIAATALENGLTVVTRNIRHFASTGVPTLNPFG